MNLEEVVTYGLIVFLILLLGFSIGLTLGCLYL